MKEIKLLVQAMNCMFKRFSSDKVVSLETPDHFEFKDLILAIWNIFFIDYFHIVQVTFRTEACTCITLLFQSASSLVRIESYRIADD